jgi:hypothetical protein
MNHPSSAPYGSGKIVVLYVGSEWTTDGKHGAITTSQSGGPNMEARLSKLEADVEHIKSDISEIKSDIRGFRKENKEDFAGVRKEARDDFRILFGSLIVVALGLAGIMSKVFGWL